MKKLIKILIIGIFIVIIVFLLKNFYYKNYDYKNINVKNEELKYNVKYKGLINAVDFAVDEYNNYYIAYKNKIQVIESNGKSYDLFNNNNLNIFSLDCNGGNLYFSSGTNVYRFNLKNNKMDKIIENLPNYGDYKDSIVRIKGDYLYVTIGAATNSGVVGEDNHWTKEYPYMHDVTPKDITIKGINFGKDKTGAFQSYKTKSLKGQIIPEHFPGNSSIIIYNTKTGNSETFAWGIRNITGLDFTNESKLIASVGGMEDRGSRPISGDSDYIYEIKKGVWYGWPDYSGGDPVNSPRFKSSKYGGLQFILENHPTTNPPAPIYQHKSVNTIKSLAVDSNGDIGEKNCIYFYDKSDNVVYRFSGAGAIKEEMKFNSNTEISNMKFKEGKLFLLDEKGGILYSIEKNNINKSIKINNDIYVYLITVIILGIVVLILKLQKNNQ
jgi:hypothetical protein